MVEHDPNQGIALAFDDFGWGELSAEADAHRCSETELVSRAISEYLRQLEADEWGRAGTVPDFARDAAARRRQINIELPADQIERLRTEASRQRVSVPQLVIHAVLLRLGRS